MVDLSKLSILVVGSGGREHALVQMCLKSPLAERVIAAPGNGGMATEVDCFDVSVEDIEGLVQLAQGNNIGLVIVGPEVPLSLGLVDALAAVGIPAYGPNKDGAQLEPAPARNAVFLGPVLHRRRVLVAQLPRQCGKPAAAFNDVGNGSAFCHV